MTDSRFSSIFNEIYGFQPRFVASIRAKFSDCCREEAEDLFQEVCCIVFENLQADRVSDTANWWHYVMTVGRNQMTKRLRAAKKEMSIDTTPLSETDEDDFDAMREERLTKLESVLS
ncbi:MAG: hypothetical protein K2G69_05265, partial [Muribaculaceae bacterium]|nr:hypothetical protein [Muribaculaceae bacterium]